MAPKEMKRLTVVSQVHKTMSSTITFKNPFLEGTTVLVLLESSSGKDVYTLLNKKAKIQVGPLATVQIPFSFCPTSMAQHSADIIISTQKPPLQWVYRVTGVAEAPHDPTLHTFTVRARESLETYYPLTLVGLTLAP